MKRLSQIKIPLVNSPHLPYNRFMVQEVTAYLEQHVMEELRETYGDLFSGHITVLAEALEKIYVRTKKRFVFLIDEWDCVMRER